MTRVLAVDWGERRIGLALSDPTGTLATGLETLVVRSAAEAVRRVAEVAREREAGRIVVGLPLLLSGGRGEAAEAAQRFADALAAAVTVPVETYDERLTSALSARRLREAGVRAGRDRRRVDQGAAVALLESYLQRLAARARGDAP
uniref:Putative pre-16S rRNA nuclease n=1 Tax=Eiseniibacteriota bacterium TaxID=2212470 RepID=A0A832MN84_UNCEI